MIRKTWIRSKKLVTQRETSHISRFRKLDNNLPKLEENINPHTSKNNAIFYRTLNAYLFSNNETLSPGTILVYGKK